MGTYKYAHIPSYTPAQEDQALPWPSRMSVGDQLLIVSVQDDGATDSLSRLTLQLRPSREQAKGRGVYQP